MSTPTPQSTPPSTPTPSTPPSRPSTPDIPTILLTTYPPILALMSLEHHLLSPTPPPPFHPSPYALCPLCLKSELSLAGIPPVHRSLPREPALLLPCGHLVGFACWNTYLNIRPDEGVRPASCPLAGCGAPLAYAVCECEFDAHELRGWIPWNARIGGDVVGLREGVEGMAGGLPEVDGDGKPRVPGRCRDCVWGAVERGKGEADEAAGRARRAGEREAVMRVLGDREGGRRAREERAVAEAERVLGLKVVMGLMEREFVPREVRGRAAWRCRGCRKVKGLVKT
ncbi:hypothetical protein QBC39DRAFT_404496 [Podospora conica]|nr:hypothetical protein QBC39DRAFT_404496 [Schizothecium conicum]